jgi:hypothetical protein
MNYPDYIGFPAGSARVVDQARVSDGSTALRIHNFNMDERGNLDSTFHTMPLVGNGWTTGTQPAAFADGKGVIGMTFARMHGNVPEILFVTTSGVFRFAPWLRSSAVANGGLQELFIYKEDTEVSVVPLGRRWYPPQFEQVGNRVYFTLGDGGLAYVWDGNTHRLRKFGYTHVPGAPEFVGPASTSNTAPDNAGGFSVRGRIGTTDLDVGTEGSLLAGEWVYAVVLENTDGAYSATSSLSGSVLIADEKSAAARLLDNMRRRFWGRDIAKGPDPTAARIILRSPNLRYLPDGMGPELRFLHRLPSNVGTEWVDDIPDGELGPVWEHRAPAPTGF